MQQFSVRFVLLCCCRMWRLWWTTERIFYNISSRAFWRIDQRRPFASGRRICWEEILLLLWIGCWWVELVISLNKFALCISPVLFLTACLFANTWLWQARRRQRNLLRNNSFYAPFGGSWHEAGNNHLFFVPLCNMLSKVSFGQNVAYWKLSNEYFLVHCSKNCYDKSKLGATC